MERPRIDCPEVSNFGDSQRERIRFLTFAISLQLLTESLIAFSLCSSPGVQGVFVLPFFFALSVGVKGSGIELLDCSTAAVAVGDV